MTVTMCMSGCQLLVNPYADGLAVDPPATTPSAEQVRSAQVTPTGLQRDYARREVCAKDGTVTHGPLYFEDPFEDKGSDDGRFAWTGQEYLHLIYGPGRYLVSGGLFPASAAVTPPWVVMASDGKLSRRALGTDHDAERWSGEPVDK